MSKLYFCHVINNKNKELRLSYRHSVVMKVATPHKAAGVTVLVCSQEMANMASGVVIRNSKIERETHHIGETSNGTIEVIVNMDGGQHLGNIQHMLEEFLQVHVIQVFIVPSFQLFNTLKKKNIYYSSSLTLYTSQYPHNNSLD